MGRIETFTRSLFLFFTAFVIQGQGTPTLYSKQNSRRQNSLHLTCGNAPNITAGNYVPRSAILPQPFEPELIPAAPSDYPTYLWCAATTNTSVFIHPIPDFPPAEYATALNETYTTIREIIHQYGDGVVLLNNQWFSIQRADAVFFVQASNGHGLTWGVTGAALTALWDFMAAYGYQTAKLHINDGFNEVGVGMLGVFVRENKSCVLDLKGMPCEMASP